MRLAMVYETRKSVLSGGAHPSHNPIFGENRVLSMIRQQQSKTSRTGKRAIQLAGSAVEAPLGLDLVFLFLTSVPGMAAWSLRACFENLISSTPRLGRSLALPHTSR